MIARHLDTGDLNSSSFYWHLYLTRLDKTGFKGYNMRGHLKIYKLLNTSI